MKRKLTKLTKIGILLFAISISLTNCQQDDITSNLTKQEIGEEASFKSSKISFDKISQNELLTSRVQTLQKKLSKSNQQAQNKGEYNSTYDFMIDTNHAKYIESIDGEYHSYTFPIYRNTGNNLLENLLLSLQRDGTYRAFLVSYNLTEQQKEDLKSGKEVIGIEDQIEMTDLDNRFSSDCIAGYASHWTCAAGNNHSPVDVASGDCVQTSFTVSIEAISGFCPPGADTASTNTDTNGETGTQTNTSSGTNHGENPDGTDNTNVTEPTILSNAEKLELFIDLTPEQEFWANKQDDDVIQELMTYILINCGQDNTSTACIEAENIIDFIINITCNLTGDESAWADNLEENEEPKWGQLANKQEILDEISNISGLYGLTYEQQITALANYFEYNLMYIRDENTGNLVQIENLNPLAPNNYTINNSNDYLPISLDINRYVYSEVGGWIDFHHVFKIFEWANQNGPFLGIVGGDMGELIQSVKDNESAYSYEDLPSNLLGVAMFIRFGDDLENGSITWYQAVETALNEISCIEPEDAPNFDFIPHIVNKHYPQNFTYSPLLGNELKELHKQKFCERPINQQINIKEAHEKFDR